MMTATPAPTTVEKPILLVGAERSGSTMFRLMLDHHRRLAFQKEFEFAVDQVKDCGCRPDTEAFRHWLRTQRTFNNTGFTIDESLGYDELVHSFLIQKMQGKERVGATVHRHLERLPYLFPDAMYLHLIRDPRDVARSNIGMGWAGNVYHGVARWIEVEHAWDRFKQTLPDDRWIEVRFEELVAEPQATLTRVCQWVGLAYDEAMLGYIDQSSYDRPDPKLTQQWRRKLSEEEIRLVEARVGAMLTQRGYEPSGLPAMEVSEAKRKELARQDRKARAKFRMNKYGLPLWATDYIVRRLGTQSMRDRVRERIHAVDQKHLK